MYPTPLSPSLPLLPMEDRRFCILFLYINKLTEKEIVVVVVVDATAMMQSKCNLFLNDEK